MDWLTILTQIFEVCIIPLLGLLTAWLISFINTKRNQLVDKSKNDTMDKYINMLADTITNCVIATNQTYVENLKKDKMFTAEAQKEAFTMTYNAVMAILTDEAKDYLTEAYGDLSAYITQRIEAEVSLNK
jgi:hypothetical protein